MRDGVSQRISSSPISEGVPSVMIASGKRRTDWSKMERVFCKAEVIAGVEGGSGGRVARQSKYINRFSLARFESLGSIFSR